MKTNIISPAAALLSLILFFFAGCSKAPEAEQQSATGNAVEDRTYPAAILQKDGSILLYTKEKPLESSRKITIAEHIISSDSPVYEHLKKQLKNARVGQWVPVEGK